MPCPFSLALVRTGILVVVSVGTACADVTMPTIFGDHMVLQQEARLPVWGWADPGEKVKVSLGGDSQEAVTATDGTWRVDFAPRARAEKDAPLVLAVSGKKR